MPRIVINCTRSREGGFKAKSDENYFVKSGDIFDKVINIIGKQYPSKEKAMLEKLTMINPFSLRDLEILLVNGN